MIPLFSDSLRIINLRAAKSKGAFANFARILRRPGKGREKMGNTRLAAEREKWYNKKGKGLCPGAESAG